MPTAIRIFSAALLFAASLSSLAAAPTVTADRENTYEVEILVFENQLPDLQGGELLTHDTAKPLHPISDTAEPPQNIPGDSYMQPTLTTLLQKDGHYRILAHARWLQSLDAKDIAKPVRITSGSPANPGEIDGTIRFFMSRFLHLSVNLQFRDPASADPAAPTVYRMNEQRRIKSLELNYFDHPRFGVLARVVPVENKP
jgi:hypothetical protein